MAQDFYIVNDEKKQYLYPYSLPVSASLPGVLRNRIIPELIFWLTLDSEHPGFLQLEWGREKCLDSPYCKKYLGAWSGTRYQLIGNYQQEDQCINVKLNYKNISLGALAMIHSVPSALADYILDLANEHDFVSLLARLAIMPSPPSSVVNYFKAKYGDAWPSRVYENITALD